MLVTMKEILQDAHKNGYAAGAFNVNNMEILQAVIAAADELSAPVIIQTSEGALKYAGADYLALLVHHAAKKTKVPVALHLDHGTHFEAVMECIANGWTSVMFDGSHFELEENISNTKKIVEIAHGAGITVEAELGRLSGVEEHISVSEADAIYTNPAEAKRFVDETGVDSLAIAIGTAHGKYKGEPKLDLNRLSEIKALINMPVVLHGASGVPADAIKEAVKRGVNKINIDTDVRVALTDGIHEAFNADPDVFDPRKYLGRGRELMIEVVKSKIELFGSAGKA